MKRILLVLGIVVVFAAVLGGGYWIRSRRGQNITQTTPGAIDSFGLPTAPTAPGIVQDETHNNGVLVGTKFGLVADIPAVDFFVDSKNTITIVSPGGQIIQVAPGSSSTLSATPIENLASALFSFDGRKVVVSFGLPAARQYSVFDINTKTWQPLPQGIESVAWSPNDLRIAFFSVGDSVANLSTLDLSNPKALPKAILPLHVQDLKVDWPKLDRIILIERGAAGILGSAYAVNLTTKAITAITEDLSGLMLSWSKTVDRGLLFSSGASERGGYLNIVDGAGIITGLTITTFPEKCAFFIPRTTTTSLTIATSSPKNTPKPPANSLAPGTSLVCGIPKNYPQLRIQALPDAYEKRAVFSVDDFYSIDVATGGLAPVFAQNDYVLDADLVKIFGTKLFFVNRFDKRVYAIELAEK